MSVAEYTEISGTVSAVIYQNEENGYTILRLDTGEGEPATVAGYVPYAAPGESLIVTGTWGRHPAHGAQFKAEWVEYKLPAGDRAIYEYLASGAIRGIGPATARIIVDRFGADTLTVIEETPEKLALIKGISPKKAGSMGDIFRKQTAVRRLIEFLMKHELKPALAMRLYKCYGENAMKAFRDNPYILAEGYFGGDFSSADRAAIRLGFDADSPERLMAAVLYEMEYNLNNGHSFIPRDKLIYATAQLLGMPGEHCETALEGLIENGRIVYETVAGTDACYLVRLYEAETYVGKKLRRLAYAPPAKTPDTDNLISILEAETGIVFAARQRAAVEAAGRRNVMALTGAPGTGKTTTVKAIISLFEQMELKTVLAAPTGRAAKRMSELCGREAVTIHRLLGAGYSGELDEPVFQRSEADPIEADAIILDETSMVDILLAKSLLEAVTDGCRLIFVGDADQLPSVGPGNLFSDIIRSGIIETIELTEIFRQVQESRIIINAHKINRGEVFDLKENTNDFFFLGRNGSERTVDTVIELCSKRLPENMGILPHQIQVLSPYKKSETGTYNLNKRLQEALNPEEEGKKEKKFGEFVFREGDKVMQIRNNYDIIWRREDSTSGLGVYNGDIGIIIRIDLREETMTVDFDERLVDYNFDMLGELEPAYAMTVHKSQGSEYRAVVLVLQNVPKRMIFRKILYTAVTRARELLIIVGDRQIVKAMIQSGRRQKRYSGLKTRLAGE